MKTLSDLHDMLVNQEGFECSCPFDCDAMYAAKLRRKKQQGQLGITDRPNETPAGQLGVDHEDWGGF